MKKKNNTFVHTKSFWLFIAPCAILFTVFFLIPLFLVIGLSFTNYDGWKTLNFVGLKNYTKLLSDSKFYGALIRTFIFTLFSLPFKVFIPLLLAALITPKFVKLKGILKTMFYIPVLLSALVVGITINWMFGQEYGFINYIIIQFKLTPLNWALDPRLATFVISFASNWASTGFFMIIFIGGINNIPEELYEASSIDGATKITAFFKITIPLLAPTMFLVTLISTVNLLKEYALIQGITQGGPGNATTYIIQYIFAKGFNQFEYGYASAVSGIVMIIFILIALVQFKISRGGETS